MIEQKLLSQLEKSTDNNGSATWRLEHATHDLMEACFVELKLTRPDLYRIYHANLTKLCCLSGTSSVALTIS